jgi:amino acid permease
MTATQRRNSNKTYRLAALGDVHYCTNIMRELEEDGNAIENGDNDTNTDEIPLEPISERKGTISSARFNVLSTMVGGGSLSLPLAFHKTGNGFLGPVFIILVAASAEFCFRLLIASDRIMTRGQNDWFKKGNGSFEAVASAAFGPKALIFSMLLVWAMCFFGTVGYAVLLRDMLEPIADFVVPPAPDSTGVTLPHNLSMMTVVLLVTPLCTLQNLTALQRFGAASMISVLILGTCVLYRSLQCNLLDHDNVPERHTAWFDYIRSFPRSARDVLDVLPLFISTFVCHYQILPVHNELQRPTQERVSWWIRSTTWSAALFYLMIGFSGSMYGNCTPSGSVQGNILLDFDEDDPLLLMGRLCLALTITLAFPMLVIPARDVVIRAMQRHDTDTAGEVELEDNNLAEPLLANEDVRDETGAAAATVEPHSTTRPSESFARRLVIAVLIFWSGAAVACCVTSIDIVWDLLGSSLSILLSYLIPCGSYIILQRRHASHETTDDETANNMEEAEGKWLHRLRLMIAWCLLILFTPLMFLSTGNAISNTFFHEPTS